MLKTGKDHLEGLRDGRTIYIGGEKVEDVTTHPAFAPAAQTIAAMYDAKRSPATWVSITGGYHCGFLDSSSFFGLGCYKGSISRSTQVGLSNDMLGDWLDATLKGGATFVRPAGTTGESK